MEWKDNREDSVPPSCIFKLVGGISAILAGALLSAAHLLNLLAGSDQGTVFGPLLAFIGHIAVVFAFIGMYEAQGGRNGKLSLAGIVLSITGSVCLCALLYIDIAATYGADVGSFYSGFVPRVIHGASPLVYGLGIVLFSIALVRVRLFPRLGSISLTIGTLVFGLGSELGLAPDLFAVVGATVMGAGFVWLGSMLLVMGEAQYRRSVAVEVAGAVN